MGRESRVQFDLAATEILQPEKLAPPPRPVLKAPTPVFAPPKCWGKLWDEDTASASTEASEGTREPSPLPSPGCSPPAVESEPLASPPRAFTPPTCWRKLWDDAESTDLVASGH